MKAKSFSRKVELLTNHASVWRWRREANAVVRIAGKNLYLMASQIAKQEVESINTLPKNTPRLEKRSAWIDKIEVVERKGQAE